VCEVHKGINLHNLQPKQHNVYSEDGEPDGRLAVLVVGVFGVGSTPKHNVARAIALELAHNKHKLKLQFPLSKHGTLECFRQTRKQTENSHQLTGLPLK
jgi:hypothetical protein